MEEKFKSAANQLKAPESIVCVIHVQPSLVCCKL